MNIQKAKDAGIPFDEVKIQCQIARQGQPGCCRMVVNGKERIKLKYTFKDLNYESNS
jgi:hypothetical protein